MEWFLPTGPVPGDYALVTHDHFDHRATDRVPGATIIRAGSEVSDRGLSIRGFLDEHVPGHGPPGMPNVIFMVEAGGVRCCHWGDNRADPPAQVVEQLGRIDILMIPVDDSCHLLSYADVNGIVQMLHPRVVVPMHYFHSKVSAAGSPLRGIGGWLESQPRPFRVVGGKLAIAADVLPAEPQIWAIEPIDGKAGG
jgi:L-ascorbate metabolism protein UlaG (beta-lactamase superfamily)